MTDIVLQTSGLSKRFGKRLAVNGVNMTIRRGEIYGFIGRNGAGKTTFMRLVLGHSFADEGSIRLFGSEDLPAGRKRIGFLVEAPALFPGCTALENLKRAAILCDCAETEQELLELLNLVGLGGTGKKKAKAFSLGMRQRLGIAIALLGKPDFLVLDEPVNGLDPAGIREVRDLILKLNRERNITILISSHLLDELAKVVTRYGIINDGVLVEEIDAAELRERSRQQLAFTVDDPMAAARILQQAVPASDLGIQGNMVLLNSHFEERAELNRLLVMNDISVSYINFRSQELESYFVERMG